MKTLNGDKRLQAYVIGLALGDGNLSNPNGRAVRLRITCDKKYPQLIEYIIRSVSALLPENKVALADHGTYANVSCYSNQWPEILGWKDGKGSKYHQAVRIPDWIKERREYAIECLRGLFQTDGSIYYDRKYLMANFVCTIPVLAHDALALIQGLGYKPNMQKLTERSGKTKHTIRVSKNTEKFIQEVGLWKK